MKSIKLLTIGILFASTALFSSCSKEGCIDPDGKNYDFKAKTSDGSCVYEGSALIWFGEVTANELVSDGVSSLTYYVDNQVVGSSSASVFWFSRPNCGQNSTITITKDLASSKSKVYSYRVEDENGDIYWDGYLNFTANSCEAIELVY